MSAFQRGHPEHPSIVIFLLQFYDDTKMQTQTNNKTRILDMSSCIKYCSSAIWYFCIGTAVNSSQYFQRSWEYIYIYICNLITQLLSKLFTILKTLFIYSSSLKMSKLQAIPLWKTPIQFQNYTNKSCKFHLVGCQFTINM